MDKIGRYQVKKKIGQGGMASVYLAQDPVIKRDIAIKLFNYEAFRGNKKSIELFYLEVEAIGKLSHNGIVTIHDIGEENGVPFLVMEYLEGRTLSSYLSESYYFSPQDALDIIIQLCSALEYAHKKRLVHRDIKPGNIMLLPDGGIKLMDFGIAKLVGGGGAGDLASGVGTPGYISPEQLDGKTVDYRTDIFSSGVILYELLTGVKAFTGKSTEELRRQMAKLDLVPPSLKDKRVPPELDEIVFRALALNPEDRFSNIIEFSDALKAVRKRLLKVEAPTREVPRPAPRPPDPLLADTLRAVPAPAKAAFQERKTPVPGVGLPSRVPGWAAVGLLFLVLGLLLIFRRPVAPPLPTPAQAAVPLGFDSDVMLDKAKTFLNSGKEDEAKAVLNEVIQKDPNNPKGYFWLGKCYFQDDFIRLAKENFQKAVECDNAFSIGYLWLAKCQVKDGDPKDARINAQEALKTENPSIKEEANALLAQLGPEEESSASSVPPSPRPAPQWGALSVMAVPDVSFSLRKEGSNVPIKLEDSEPPVTVKNLEPGRYVIESTISITQETVTEEIYIRPGPPTVFNRTYTNKVSLNSTPPNNTTIIMDGTKEVEFPATLVVNVGPHTFVAQRNGSTQSKSVIVKYVPQDLTIPVSFFWNN